jgi:elongator complex protein 4
MISLPSSLFPRSAGLTRWIEILNDGVMELLPFPATSDRAALSATPGSGNEDMPQGMLKIHRLPIAHEKGSNGGSGDDLAFTLGRRKGLVIKPFSLPPVEGDTEAQQEGLSTDTGGKATKIDIEF